MADTLNPSQRAAVEHDLGPMLVLAGAGSGKTRVVTQRIARLLERGVSSRNILAMTFTNKAAAEMKERVTRLVGTKAAKDLTVSTFHRFGLDVLGQETRALGLRGAKFAIFDQADSMGVIREILREVRADRNFDVGAILTRISTAKNAFVDPNAWQSSELAGKGVDAYDEIASLVYPRYLQAMRTFQAFDFDDLICEVVNLWRRRADVLAKWAERYRYVIVDEYQDTNHAQLELTRLLGGVHRNVCVVGDDDQSIYAWRGADVRNILDFEAHFPGAKVVKLEENYRSQKAILDVAGAVLAASGGRRHQKSIVSTRPAEAPVESIVFPDPEVEAGWIATDIQERLDAGGVRPRDFAVLYRSNLQAQDVETALKERQIPLRLIGGTQFYERKEVKDLIAYLRVVLHPDDEMSLRRVLNYPARGVGDVALQKIADHATAYNQTLWNVVTRPHVVQDLPTTARDGCRAFVALIEDARARFERHELPTVVARALIDAIGLKADLHAASTTPAAAARRWGNVEAILRVFTKREEKGRTDVKSFDEFLRMLSLREEDGGEEAGDQVTLTTMHGAKGLEFRHVYVVGLEEGLLPHARALDERATDAAAPGGSSEGAHSLEEERRLFYVAVTRARDRLVLSRCRQRVARGRIQARTPSRFLVELPETLLVSREITAPAAPKAAQTIAGAASVLAALRSGFASADEPPPRR